MGRGAQWSRTREAVERRGGSVCGERDGEADGERWTRRETNERISESSGNLVRGVMTDRPVRNSVVVGRKDDQVSVDELHPPRTPSRRREDVIPRVLRRAAKCAPNVGTHEHLGSPMPFE